jgi:hypothetical protein
VLGHANIGITLDTYSHVLPNMQWKAVAAMDDHFRKKNAMAGDLDNTAIARNYLGGMQRRREITLTP